MLARIARIIRVGVPIGALLLHFVILLCYLKRWDTVSAVTVFPFWSWGLLGIALCVASWICFRGFFALVVTGIWLVTILLGSDETGGLLRIFKDAPQPGLAEDDEGTPVLRVVTLNCLERNSDSAREAVVYRPDVVLLQERPWPKSGEWKDLQEQFFGEEESFYVFGLDCAILARGRLIKTHLKAPNFTYITMALPDGTEIDVLSLRLKSAVRNTKLWTAQCWKSHADNRKERRRELYLAASTIMRNHGTRPCIIGGDFNAPAGDAVFRIMRNSGLIDSFEESGTGWGNTFSSKLALVRIDYIWTTPDLKPIRSGVVATKHSDHRMLISDFVVH